MYATPRTFCAASESRTGFPARARHQRKTTPRTKAATALRLAPCVKSSGSGATIAAGASASR